MNAILEVPSIRARVSRMSVEEYHRTPERNTNGRRTELIRGLVIEKMSRSPLHVTIASRLVELIQSDVPTGYFTRKEDPLTFLDSEPEPDVSVVAGTLGDFRHAHPTTALLAVEVSISTEAEDRLKALLYAEAAVTEYWIVLPASRTVEVYRRPLDGRYGEMHLYRLGDECAAKVSPASAFLWLNFSPVFRPFIETAEARVRPGPTLVSSSR